MGASPCRGLRATAGCRSAAIAGTIHTSGSLQDRVFHRSLTRKRRNVAATPSLPSSLWSGGSTLITGNVRGDTSADATDVPNLPPQITLGNKKGLEAVCPKSFRFILPRTGIEPALR